MVPVTVAGELQSLKEKTENPNILKSYNYNNADLFDFNDFNHNPGMYRLGEPGSLKNPPSPDLQYCNVLVTRNANTDTASMLVFPYNDSALYYRTGNAAAWETRPWRKIVMDFELAFSGKYNLDFINIENATAVISTIYSVGKMVFISGMAIGDIPGHVLPFAKIPEGHGIEPKRQERLIGIATTTDGVVYPAEVRIYENGYIHQNMTVNKLKNIGWSGFYYTG